MTRLTDDEIEAARKWVLSSCLNLDKQAAQAIRQLRRDLDIMTTHRDALQAGLANYEKDQYAKKVAQKEKDFPNGF